MHKVELTAFDLAERFVGVSELPGELVSNPQILAMLRLDQPWPKGDDVPWCSAFMNYIAWLLRLPRSKSLRARSWLGIGRPTALQDAVVGFDVVVLKRGGAKEPGPEVIAAPGHVGLFAGREGKSVLVLGGNQADAVNVARFSTTRLLGIRRLYE